MPGVGIGVYPGYDPGLNEGEEVSSTYEGRHITVLEQNLIHPDHTTVLGNFVEKGDPVIICNTVALGGPGNYGHAVGVAFNTATAITDLIAVDTEGIWLLPASSYTDGAAGSAIVAGDPLYIHDGSLAAAGALGLGDALISKIRNLVTQVPFGYALGTMVAAGTGTIAIKVHWDPRQPQDEVAFFPAGHGADDGMSVTVQDNGTHTGSSNAFHALLTKMTGDITGAGAISAINGDVQARADCSHVYAFKGYTGISGSPTLAYMTGFYVYCDDLGGATVAHYQCADFNIASNNPATNGNCFIRCAAHGAAAWAVLYFPLATGITNLLYFEQMVAPLSAGTDNTNVTLRIACYVGAFGAGTIHYLRLFSD